MSTFHFRSQEVSLIFGFAQYLYAISPIWWPLYFSQGLCFYIPNMLCRAYFPRALLNYCPIPNYCNIITLLTILVIFITSCVESPEYFFQALGTIYILHPGIVSDPTISHSSLVNLSLILTSFSPSCGILSNFMTIHFSGS